MKGRGVRVNATASLGSGSLAMLAAMRRASPGPPRTILHGCSSTYLLNKRTTKSKPSLSVIFRSLQRAGLGNAVHGVHTRMSRVLYVGFELGQFRLCGVPMLDESIVALANEGADLLGTATASPLVHLRPRGLQGSRRPWASLLVALND